MVIPIGDENPTHRRGWLTAAFVLINMAVFVFVQPWDSGTCAMQDFFMRHAAIPAELLQGEPLSTDQLAQNQAAVACGLEPAPAKPVYAAVLVSMFLHAGWLHLLGNMLYLGIFGNNVQDRFGRFGFVVFYLASGVVATVAFMVPNADTTNVLVGASGAVAGILGAYLVLFPRARVTVTVPILLFYIMRLPAILVLGMWFLLQLRAVGRPGGLGGGGVAYLAHVAGFATGMLIALGVRLSRGARGRA